MKLAENLNIHKVLEPEDFSHPDVDDLSVMTYLSYFCNPANEHLMKWVQSKIPERKITNFKTDWNNGINLACLVDALNPGIIPDARDLDPHDALDNLVRGMKIAEDHLAVKPVIKPSQMADPNVDELNVATYLSRFQYAKPVPQPHEVTCSGHGLYKAFLGRPAHFEVDASRGGVGDLKVTITAVGGSPVTAEITPNEHHKGTFEVKYVPQAPGKLKIAVQWSGFVIPASPFTVDVLDPGAFSFTGKQITGGQCARVGKPVIMTAKGLIDIGDLYVLIQHTDGHTEAAKVVPKGTGEAECSYTPVRVGKDEVFAKIAGEDIPGSPFEVTVVDPGQCSVALKDPPPGKPVPVNYKATFVVGASEANLQGVIAEAKTPTGIQELNVVTQRDGTNLGYFTPVVVGSFSIIVTCAGENIRGSPLIMPVSDPSRCAFLDTVPRYLQVGKPVELNISTKGAGPGELEVYSSQTGLLGAAIKKGERDFYALRLVPNAVGDSTVELKWNKATVSHTPFTVFVVDASKCSAYGPGLSEGKGKIGEAFVFTVQTARAGRGELVIKPKGPKSVYAAEITHDRDDTYTVKFTTYEQGPHSIEVLWGNTPIPNSPYKIQFVRGADAAQFTATGEGLKHAVALDVAECMLVGPEAGLLESGVLAVRVSGNQLESKVVNKSKFNPKCGQLVVCITDIGNGSYDVKYAAPKPGSHSLSITCDDKHIPGSPFQIDVLPPGDASKCKAFGPAIDNPKSQVVGKPLEFKVDSTTAGTGQLVVTATDPSLHTLPVFVAEDKTMAKERIHNIKIEPKVQGKHKVEVTWGGSQIPGSPFSFEVSDPKHIKILGLPDSSSFIAVVGEPITFAVDAQRAGKGEVKAAAKLEDGKVDAFGKKMKENGTIGLTYTPKESGKMELLLTFSGINLLRLPWICQIANPRQFQVIPPKRYGKQKEYVKFPITGVTSDTQNFQLTATHPQHNATVKTEPGKGEGTVIARFTAKQIGEYTVEVKHGGRHIDGSPFKTQVANPNGCRITSNIPKVLHIGVAESLAIDASESGPGEPGCLAEVLSGEGEIQPEISEEEEGKYTLKFTPEKIGKCRFVVKWADYVIPLTPFTVSFVDSSTITWACPELEKGYTNQGDVIEIQIDCREGGQAAPEVKATGPKSPYTVQIIDHKDGTFAAKINPWQVGENSVDILWGGRSIPNSPIKFEVVRGVEARTITASGEGLHRAIAGQPAEIQINTPEEGLIERGVLSAKCTSENVTEDQDPNAPSLDLKDSGSGSYTLTMVAPVEGQYQLVITCEGQPIVGSPFNITVSSAPNADKCNAFGGAIEKKTGLVVKDPVQFSVDTTDAGTGHLTVSATQPNGNPIRVYMLEEGGERKLHHLKLDPQVIGHYSVAVFWEEDLIPGSPFDFNILDPSKCKVNGLPLPTGTAHINETVPFTVLFKDAGQDVSPSVTVSLPGDGEQITLNPTPESTATLSYAYVPDMLGFSRINVSYGGYDVPGSPFKCLVTDPSQFHITPLNIKGDYALVCELVSFGIVGKIPEGERLAVAAHGPSADLNVEVVDKGDGSSIATFVPIEPGSYEVFVECAGSHVTGSPFTVYVADPSKCQFLGDIPNTLQVGKPEEFVVKTRGAGAGNLAVLLDNLKENQYVDCKIENQGLDTHAVTLTGKKIGEANVELQWAGYTIPQSPFKVMVCDAQQCKAYGQALMSKKGRAGEMITFTVVAIHAGKGKLTVRPRGPSAQYNVDMKETKDLTYEVSFTPWEVGEHKVDVLWGDAHIPKSPFVINVDNPVDTNVCNATGEGLKEAIAGHTATFTIISSEIGLLDKNALRVSVIGVQSAAEVKVKDNNNGSYTVEYVAPTAGAYIASVAFYDRQIPGSPFKVNVVPGPDATKCRAYGPALHPNSLHIAGTPLEFYVDTSEGGHGSLRVYVQGPHDYRPKIYQADDGKGVYSIKFDAMKSGKYFLVVAWSDQHIPGSPFKVRVHPAADASKVKVYGPGLEDGYLEDGGVSVYVCLCVCLYVCLYICSTCPFVCIFPSVRVSMH